MIRLPSGQYIMMPKLAYRGYSSPNVFLLRTAMRLLRAQSAGRPHLGNAGRLRWRMSRETLRCQVPEVM